MTCVTPADLGKPIAAIVQRCGPPGNVASRAGQNQLFYTDAEGHAVTITFDADQTRARIILFRNTPAAPAREYPAWTVALPFASGAREAGFGKLTPAAAGAAFAPDADVTTKSGAAFRSTPLNDVVLAFEPNASNERVLRAAWVGERAALVQTGIIASPIGAPPLDYISPIPRDAWLKNDAPGSQTTIVRADVDAEGIVRKISVIVPSSDAAFDAALYKRIDGARFRPATLENRHVSGSYFAQVRHE